MVNLPNSQPENERAPVEELGEFNLDPLRKAIREYLDAVFTEGEKADQENLEEWVLERAVEAFYGDIWDVINEWLV